MLFDVVTAVPDGRLGRIGFRHGQHVAGDGGDQVKADGKNQ